MTADCSHCWHGTGHVLESYPPQYPEVCCHCGAKRRRRETLATGHGPYAPGGSQEGREGASEPRVGTLYPSEVLEPYDWGEKGIPEGMPIRIVGGRLVFEEEDS